MARGAYVRAGRGVYIEDGVTLGDRVKVQTNALLFKPARIGDDVFIGPAVILTNDRYPRSSTPDGQLKREDDWTAEGVIIDEGASIGARSVILPGVHIGRFAMVAAGAIATRDVSDFAIVLGDPRSALGGPEWLVFRWRGATATVGSAPLPVRFIRNPVDYCSRNRVPERAMGLGEPAAFPADQRGPSRSGLWRFSGDALG